MLTNPVRAALRDGFRCMRRYKTIWVVLFTFGFCYALFELGRDVFLCWILPEGADRPIFQWHRAWFLPHDAQIDILKRSVLPAFESVAGIFNNVVTTFPFSAMAALLLLINKDGHYGVLNKTLRRRFGAFGWAVFAGISLCAVAA